MNKAMEILCIGMCTSFLRKTYIFYIFRCYCYSKFLIFDIINLTTNKDFCEIGIVTNLIINKTS